MGRDGITANYGRGSRAVTGRTGIRFKEKKQKPSPALDQDRDAVASAVTKPVTQKSLKHQCLSLSKRIGQLESRAKPFERRIMRLQRLVSRLNSRQKALSDPKLRLSPQLRSQRLKALQGRQELAQAAAERLQSHIDPWKNEARNLEDQIEIIEARLKGRFEAHNKAQQAFHAKQMTVEHKNPHRTPRHFRTKKAAFLGIGTPRG